MEFKVGDKVRCVDPGPTNLIDDFLRFGKIYTVTDISMKAPHNSQQLIILNNSKYSYYSWRFKLLEHYNTPLGKILYG